MPAKQRRARKKPGTGAPVVALNLPEVMTPAQFAQAFSMHQKTVYKLRVRDGLPFVRVGGAIRFLREDVLRWLEARKEG